VIAREKIAPLAAAALAALLAAAPVRAQVAAPRLVEETEEEPSPPPPREAPPAPRASPPAEEPAPRAEPAPPAAPPAPAPPPVAAAPAPGAGELARRIQPVTTSHARLMALWAERRAAVRESDPARVEAAQRAILAGQRELGIENLLDLSAAEVRESRRALAANLPADGVAHATVAAQLAPDFADAHLALARARLAHAPGEVGAILSAVGDALAAARRDPPTARAFLADASAAILAALFGASLGVTALLFLRRVRLFLHDVHHLPLLRGAAPVQAGFLALVLLAIPLALGLGPFAVAATGLLAVWLYLSTAERVVASAALAALLALPWAAEGAARLAAWTGTPAEVVDALERGALSDEAADAVAARAAAEPAPAALGAALGRHYKRRGALDEALRWYRAAAGPDEGSAALQVNVGNVLFLKGDAEGAKAAYLAATDRAQGDLVVLAAAHYNLSKLYVRTSDMEKSAAAREKAEREAPDFLRRYGSDDEFSANRYLVDVPVPAGEIAALARADAGAETVGGWARAAIAGRIPRAAWPWAGAAALALLWLLALAGRGLAPARACDRCGGAACVRCDPAAKELCGQCVNVYLKKGVVDARDRLRKEAQVRRHVRVEQLVARALAVAAGGAGPVWTGAVARGALLLLALLFAVFLAWFWRGVSPPPQPSPYVLLGKLAVAIPAALVAWGLAVRETFRLTR
jgi:tetratricopeptide (TPR) repeat protein